MNYSILIKILFLFTFIFTAICFVMKQIDRGRFLGIILSLLFLFLIHLMVENKNNQNF